MNQFTYQRGINDLATLYPNLVEQWDFERNGDLTPSDVTSKTRRKAYWICGKGHSWEASIASRTGGRGCPYCAGKVVISGKNDLLSQRPMLAKEWDENKNGNLSPSQVHTFSHKKVWWIGTCGHSFEASVSNRSNGTECPYCCGKKVLKGFNDFASAQPDMCDEWNFEKNNKRPEEVSRWSSENIWWRCKNGHEWQTEIQNRMRGNGCPYCANKRPVEGVNDFRTMNPLLMQEWNYQRNKNLSPDKLTYQTRKKVWWICQKGHEWQAEIYDRRNGTGCPTCARYKSKHPVIAGKDDLATLRPDLITEWDYERNQVTPEQLKIQSNKKVWWKCKEGHCWRSTVQSRVVGTGCPRCMGKTPMRGYLI